jgi:hypothetical protein
VLTVPNKELDTFALLVLITIWGHSAVQWYFTIPFTTLFGFSLLYPKLRLSWLFWCVIAAIHGFAIAQLWMWEGNGLVLFFYTSLTLTLALASDKPWQVLRLNARFLIGVIFLLAALWKMVSPDFTSGKFMEFYLLSDSRIAPIAAFLTPLTLKDVRENQAVLEKVPEESVQLKSADGVRPLAGLLTVLTLALEGLVAIVFLLPLRPMIRDGVFVTFLASAYLTITVPSFGMILACLGFAQTSNPRLQTVYKIICLLLPLISIRFFLTT